MSPYFFDAAIREMKNMINSSVSLGDYSLSKDLIKLLETVECMKDENCDKKECK